MNIARKETNCHIFLRVAAVDPPKSTNQSLEFRLKPLHGIFISGFHRPEWAHNLNIEFKLCARAHNLNEEFKLCAQNINYGSMHGMRHGIPLLLHTFHQFIIARKETNCHNFLCVAAVDPPKSTLVALEFRLCLSISLISLYSQLMDKDVNKKGLIFLGNIAQMVYCTALRYCKPPNISELRKNPCILLRKVRMEKRESGCLL